MKQADSERWQACVPLCLYMRCLCLTVAVFGERTLVWIAKPMDAEGDSLTQPRARCAGVGEVPDGDAC